MPRNPTVARDGWTPLQQIPNIGPAIADDLHRIGIRQPSELRDRDPYIIYDQLCQHDGTVHDPCVLDVFIAAVDYMNGGPAQPWWKYTAQRKRTLAARQQPASNAPAGKLERADRRRFLRNGALLFLAADLHCRATIAAEPDQKRLVHFGIMTDMHYADKPPAGTRHYRETPAKLKEAARQFQAVKPDFVIELGDVIDSAKSVDAEKRFLRTIHRQFAKLPGDHYCVLGNHCVSALTKQEFLDIVGQPRAHYSFDINGIHFVALDACFRNDMVPYGRNNFQWTDANVPPEQLKWLKDDLRQADKNTIVFIHQRLDVDGHYAVKNAAPVRKILEQSGRVLAVFQGHYHRNDHREIGGIHYVTIAAMVEGSGPESNAYAMVSVAPDGTIQVNGFSKQKSYDFEAARR